jgi:hypothetical protein
LEFAADADRSAGGHALEHDPADRPDGQVSYRGCGDSGANHNRTANDLKG